MRRTFLPVVRRILMTADTVGGVWTYALELAEALQDYGVEIALATMGKPLSEQQRASVEKVHNVEVFESDYKLEWMQDPWDDIEAAGKWLLEIEEYVRPDLVHLNGYVHGSLAWCSPVLIVGHSCVYSWFEAVRGTAPSESWERYRREVSRGLFHADLVTAPTKAMLSALTFHYGSFVAAGPIYNGRKATTFLPAGKEPLVFTAGRLWDEAKNIIALQRVSPGLPWPVYVAGERRHPDGGGACFDGLNLIGMLDEAEMVRWFGRAAVYALPARYEPFGLSALEAGLAGCALVLGDLPSLREVWGNAALFVPSHDSCALEDALRTLMTNAPLRDRLARQARWRALQFTAKRMGLGYMTLYEELMRFRSSSLFHMRRQAGGAAGRALRMER